MQQGHAKALALVIAAYALSPIDLIPDFVPVLGHLDELILLPLAILLAVKLVPAEVMAEHRATALAAQGQPVSRAGAGPRDRALGGGGGPADVVALAWRRAVDPAPARLHVGGALAEAARAALGVGLAPRRGRRPRARRRTRFPSAPGRG